MRLLDLRISNLRLIESLQLELAPGWNLFEGANGAGKTTLLEAVFLLSHGRSFRPGAREALAGPASNEYSVFAQTQTDGDRVSRVGIARTRGRHAARIDAETVTLAELTRRVAVVCFEPGSHALIAGGAEERRRFVDWGVFHVEHDFIEAWRRYQRALRQRNILLRAGLDAGVQDDSLSPWDHELAEAAEPLNRFRSAWIATLRPVLAEHLARFLPELGELTIRFEPGWDTDRNLREVLAVNRKRDLARGFTSRGPHRADWSLEFPRAPRREHLSRGQEKLCALACALAQAALFATQRGHWPVICLDDLASELDAAHFRSVIENLHATPAQVLATGTDTSAFMSASADTIAMFHVEHGEVHCKHRE